jgi:hypothetical protein
MDGNRGPGRGGGVMKDIAKIVIAILIVVVAWKLLKGLVGLLVGIALAGLVVYAGVKLIEGPRR